MLKLKCGTYNQVPILYTEYLEIKKYERQLTYKLPVLRSIQGQPIWFAVMPWYPPIHAWTWSELCNCFGMENIEIDEKGVKAYNDAENAQQLMLSENFREDFQFFTEPRSFQFQDFLRWIYWPRMYLALDCGMGKTKIALDGIRYRNSHALYLCPKPLIGNMIAEVDKHARGEIDVFACDAEFFQRLGKKCSLTSADFKLSKGQSVFGWESRRAEITEYLDNCWRSATAERPAIYLTTYATGANYAEIFHEFLDYDTLVADEAHKVKNHESQRTKGAWRLAEKALYRYPMSGTMAPGTTNDTWAQYRMTDSLYLGEKFKKHYDRYSIPDDKFRTKAKGFKNLDKLNKILSPITIIQTKKQFMKELPSRTVVPLTCDLSGEEKKAYIQMCTTDWEAGDTFTFRDKSLVIRQASVKMIKLKQICSGFINMAQPHYELCDKPCPHARDCARDGIEPNSKRCKVDPTPIPPDIEFMKNPGKIETLIDLVDNSIIGTADKLLVFAHFRAELDMIEKVARDLKVPQYRIDGGTKDAHAVTRSAAGESGPAIVIAQVSCGVGWNFTESHKTAYYSTDFDFVNYKQSHDRVHRLGQTMPVIEWHLHGRNSLDPLTKKLMDAKEKIFNTLMSGDCCACEYFKHCSSEGIEKWSEKCIYATEYRRPDLGLWRHEMEITKWAKEMV